MRTLSSERSSSRARLALLSTASFLPFSSSALAADVVPAAPSGAPPPPPLTVGTPNPDLVSRWQVPPTSPWAPYEKSTLLAALNAGPELALPDVRNLDVVGAAIDAAASAAAAGVPSDVMWLVDLPGAASVAFAATLSQRAREAVVPILTFNNWPAENETVPAEDALAALVVWQPGATSGAEGARPVFVLDSWRLAYPAVTVDEETTDNRYMLGPADFPDVDVLRREGITRVLYVVESRDDAPVEEDDLNATFLEYAAAGIDLAIVDLEDLSYWPRDEAGASGRPNLLISWDGWFRRYVYPPRVRPTIISDPLFYGRSRGGFGVVSSAWSAHAAMYGSGHGGG
jgi:hypothetical protein